jgi:hypothetical protein
MDSVYSAVRTGALNTAVCASALEGQYCSKQALCLTAFTAKLTFKRLEEIRTVKPIVDQRGMWYNLSF